MIEDWFDESIQSPKNYDDDDTIPNQDWLSDYLKQPEQQGDSSPPKKQCRH